jgi:steroid delta-isomerase-like uncharacterized protein
MRKRRALYLLGALGGVVFLSKRSKGALMHHQKEIVRSFIEDPWTKGLDVLDELVSPDFVGYDPTLPEPIRGIDGVKEFTKMFKSAFPDGGLTIDEIVGDGDHVAVRWTGRGTHEGELMGIPPTGKEVTLSGASFLHLSGHKIVEDHSTWDTHGMLVQLGVAEAPVSA